MNINSNNAYSDLIYLFLDGETDGAQQKILFEALAGSSDLQSEFQQALDIKSGFEADKEILAPSGELTNGLFAKVGFPVPDAAAPAPALIPTPASTGFVMLMQKLAYPFISAIAGSVVTALLFYFFLLPKFNGGSPGSNRSGEGFDRLNYFMYGNQGIASISSFDNPAASEVRRNDEGRIRRKSMAMVERIGINDNNLPAADVKPQVEDSQASVMPEESFTAPIVAKIRNFASSLPASIELKRMDAGSLRRFSVLDASELQKLLVRRDNSFALEFKGLTGLGYFPWRQIDPEPQKVLNNFALGLSYNIDPDNSLMIFAGKESFQMFDVNENESGLIFTKEPILFWAGLNYRHTFSDLKLIGIISPYAEGLLGGSKYGPIAKLGLGLSYNPENFISFNIGIEGTGQIYMLRKQLKMSEKLGLTYNVVFHF